MALSATAASGCAELEDTNSESESLAGAVQPLWSAPGAQYWPNGKVPVCFGAERWTTRGTNPYFPEPAPTGSSAWVRQTTRIREVLETNFENIPGFNLDFTGFGTCAQPEVGTFTGGLRITVRDGGQFNWAFRHCAPGEYYRDSNGDNEADGCDGSAGYTSAEEAHIVTSENYKPWGPSWDGVVLHEVMHALGFKHEFDRMDRNPPGDCRANSGGTAGPPYLTIYDPMSIMNFTYCDVSKTLTSLDQLGLEIIYPRSFTSQPVASPYSLQYGTNGFMIRTSDHVMTSWSVRGAKPEVYQGISWYRGGVFQRNTLTYPATALGAGVSQIRASFADPLGRTHNTQTLNVMVNDGLYGAVLSTLL